jgi:2-keto-4-pentenoate hydratase/2-oxohepta-3-ene-1,7-dioic acid hydratase in catechol pathway
MDRLMKTRLPHPTESRARRRTKAAFRHLASFHLCNKRSHLPNISRVIAPKTRIAAIIGLPLLLAMLAVGYWLFRPLPVKPVPATFHHYDLNQGSHVPLDPPPGIFAIGLSYAKHIEETASDFDPDAVPPVFRKDLRAFVRTGADVAMPDSDALCAAAEELEPGLGKMLRKEYSALSPLLDYEGELGFVLLEDVDPQALSAPGFIPRLGFFISNDLSARTLAIMGEDQPNRYDYWGASKSFPGFMPVGDLAWVPDEPRANGIPSVVIETKVNGQTRQKQTSDQLVYTPLQMLRFIHAAYPESQLHKGAIVLTGTPGGVALKSPRWQVRLANLIGMSRFKKLSIKLESDLSTFLKPGDRVVVSGGKLGSVAVTITDKKSTSQIPD